jgi:hypothetical protein
MSERDEIVIEDAEREGVPLLISIAGASGSGKTPCALRLARGLAAQPGDDLSNPDTLEEVDRHIVMVDGDAKRSLFYAPAAGERPGHLKFRFRRIDWQAPFTPGSLEARVDRAEKAPARVIIIDSFSYVWDAPGGCVEAHDEFCAREVERSRKFALDKGWRFDEDKAWDRASMEGWKHAKRPHSLMVTRLLQCRAHLIFCMHADDKLRFGEEVDERSGKKKATITQPKDLPIKERWVPICEKKFPRNLSDRILLVPERPGYPIVQRAHNDHLPWFDENRMIDEQLGVNLAAWARGASTTDLRTSGPMSLSSEGGASSPRAPSTRGPVKDAQAGPPSSSPRNDEGFPGDLPPPDAEIAYAGARYVPTQPQPILLARTIEEMSSGECQQYGKLLRELIVRAPAYAKRAWFDQNTPELVRLKARSPALFTWISEVVPQAPSAPASESVDPPADAQQAAMEF